MNTETINTQLYEKMFAEQERYRDWLLHQTPEEILNHTYEYTTREDILMTLEDNDLSFEQAWALLSSPTPLADVFKEFENRETDYMDVVRESMASRANTIIDRHQAPLYLHDAAYAVAHNEMEHYTASLRISAACKNMIEDAIAAAYQDNSLKDVREASKAVIDTFGFDRTMFVLANTIRIKNYDGRISTENKTWAQTIPICEDQLNILVDRCNPGLLDLFANQVRKDFAAEQQRSQQKVSVREKLHGTPARAAETVCIFKERSGCPMKKRRRTIPLMFYVTPEERDQIEAKMAQLGTNNMSAYLRKIAIDGYVVQLDLPELREMVSLLRRSSNNLNQLARRANETGRIYPEDLADIRQNQAQLWESAKEILRVLSTLD